MLVFQPTIFRENTSMVNAVYTVPAQVETYVKSATHNRFGAPAVNWRFTRSGARAASGSGTVVRTFLPRTAPTKPNSRISRSTRHRPTAIPSRFNTHHTFSAPYTE
jgi:hypothetical protein